ncbi:MAG: hypothetical protein CVU73_07085 [Deltaproteobacteria bacterium HGW-Deltaproteobacteria-8]|nr:MAG: hypothetical protein CVU73_07085 [Deltaproteobacteria bacterium HGW-Deltaproteobacteria-8]
METHTAFKKFMGHGMAFFQRRAVRWTLGVLTALVLLFGALGYFWLPGFAKAKLEVLLSEQLARPVHIERIEISPYALSVQVSGFSIGELSQNGTEQEFVGFDRLFVNLSSATLFRRVPVVSEVRLTGPRVRVVRQADGRYNFSDILDKLVAAPVEQPEKPAGPTPQFSVANITLSGGSVVFEDQLADSAQAVTEISLGVPFIANTPGTVESYVQPSFSAKVNGALLTLEGKARPFAPGQDAAIELNVADFDLMRLARYLPPGLPAKLTSARLDADLRVSFAQPQGKEAQVRVNGKAALCDLALASASTGGGAKGKAQGGSVVRLKKAELTLDEATLAGALRAGLVLTDFSVARGGGKPLLGFAALEAKGVTLALAERKAAVAEVLLSSPFGAVRHLADGSLDAQKLAEDFTAPAVPKVAVPKATPAKATGPAQAAKPKADAKLPAKAQTKAPDKFPAKPWSWSVGRVAVTGGSLHFADETLGKRARQFSSQELALTLEGLSSAPGTGVKMDFSTRVNERGSIAVKGGLRLAPLGADLDVALAHVDLVALQGWATQNLNAVLTRGEVSVKGRLKLAGQDASFAGDVALIDLNVLDKLNASDLLRWRSLRLTALNAGSSPLRFGAGEIALSSFYARVLLTPEGRLNLQDVVKREDAAKQAGGQNVQPPQQAKAQAAPGVALTGKSAPAAAEKSGPAPQINIGRVSLSGGNIVFTDHFIKPNYTANLTDLAGSIGPIRPGAQTEVAIRGKVDRTAPLEITGKMDPLAKPLSLDIRAKATGIEMSNFSPYTGRYVGYAIEKGKLSVDVRYHVDKGLLKAENQVFLDQLTIGKKVDSKDAMNIPLGLVVALLSDSNGQIDINLPIEGSLDDPQFSLGGIIVKVIMNLLVKAATSPFKLLASLFSGGGEELSYLVFEPGRAEITAESEQALQTLSKALRDRPGLKLELAGHTDPQVEAEGLRRASLEHRVKAQKATELARRGKASGSVDQLDLTAEEYPRYLERVYKAADFKKPRNLIGLAKGLPVEQMEALLLQNTPVRPEDMERLAQDRGIAVQAWLVEKGGIEQARVFLLGPRVDSDAPKGVKAGGRVDFSLR